MEPNVPKANTMIRSKLIVTSILALAAFSALAPLAPAEAGRRGRNVAAGVLIGAAALAIIAGSANARSRRSYDDDDYGHRRSSYRRYPNCRQLYRECDRGNDHACERYDRVGCAE
jgi:hypothetical protein